MRYPFPHREKIRSGEWLDSRDRRLGRQKIHGGGQLAPFGLLCELAHGPSDRGLPGGTYRSRAGDLADLRVPFMVAALDGKAEAHPDRSGTSIARANVDL